MNKLVLYYRWLWQAKLALIILLSISIFPFLLSFIDNSEFSIRLYGVFCQMIGIFLILYELSMLAKYFEKKTLVERVAEWVRSVPFARNHTNFKISGAAAGAAGARLRVKAPFVYKTDSTIDDRLEAIRQKMNQIDERIDSASEEFWSYREKIDNEMNLVQKEIKGIERRLGNKIEESHISGIAFAEFGTIMIGIGIIYSTFPELIELYRFY
ncbi:MAG: hypothetical protein R6V44_12180 [Paracoccaceae bacterium]